MKEIRFAVDDSVWAFVKVLAERVGDVALLQVIQNFNTVNIGDSLNRYKPIVVLLAEFLRRTFLESTIGMKPEEVEKEADKFKQSLIEILQNTNVAPDMKPPTASEVKND